MIVFLACLLMLSLHPRAIGSPRSENAALSSVPAESSVASDTLRIAKIDIAAASRHGSPVNVQRAMGKQGPFYLLQLKNRNPRRRTIIVSLYLFDQATGSALKTADGGYTCNPCTYVLDREHRSYEVSLDDLVRGKAGKIAKEMDVFGALLIEGDADFLVAKTLIR
ncbi:MAG: hypothetical protein GXO82_10340, partial [Chlorobi bacterium]|nr:hypothetical protein [Chlorobiota bacterium]